MAELKPGSAVVDEEVKAGELAYAMHAPGPAKGRHGFFPEVEGKEHKAGDIITVLIEATPGFSNSIDETVFGGTLDDGEPFLIEEGSLQEKINIDRFVEFSPAFIETFSYVDDNGFQKEGRTILSQPLFYLLAKVTGYDVSGDYAMMRVKPLFPENADTKSLKAPVEFSQLKNDLARKIKQAVFSDDSGGLPNLIREITLFKTDLAIYDALQKAGNISKKAGKVSLMAKEISFASIKENVDAINMAGSRENYMQATMKDFDAIYEMVKLQLPYYHKLDAKTKENIADKVRLMIAKHDVKVLPVKGKPAFFAAYNTELSQVVSFGYMPVPGANEALLATWGLRRCLSLFSDDHNVKTFYVDGGPDNLKFGRSNVMDILEKKMGMDSYQVIGGHRFYSIEIQPKT